MENTLQDGDLLFSSRLDREIERYDIVTFHAPDDPDEIYIKRVIGLPGETITVKTGQVCADGHVLDSSFVNQMLDCDGDGEYKVPDNCYFVMGDNRDDSLDSRYFENWVTKDSIISSGTFFRIYPFDKIGEVSL